MYFEWIFDLRMTGRSCTGHLENFDLPNVETFYYAISKNHIC